MIECGLGITLEEFYESVNRTVHSIENGNIVVLPFERFEVVIVGRDLTEKELAIDCDSLLRDSFIQWLLFTINKGDRKLTLCWNNEADYFEVGPSLIELRGMVEIHLQWCLFPLDNKVNWLNLNKLQIVNCFFDHNDIEFNARVAFILDGSPNLQHLEIDTIQGVGLLRVISNHLLLRSIFFVDGIAIFHHSYPEYSRNSKSLK
ncbi:hypothetical protein M5689_020527 [Euphorbia peplus]|nr:hypothetical protein M5689_020527 [Euphorbia peplus]